MPDIFVRNSGNNRLQLQLSADDRGDHHLEPGQQAKVVCTDADHHGFIKSWLDRYGVDHQDTAFDGCGEAAVIEPKPPKKEG